LSNKRANAFRLFICRISVWL